MCKILFFLCALASMLCSCDPLRRLQMKNQGSGDAEFIWKLKEHDSLHRNPFFMSNSDIVEFKLKNTKPHNFVNMSFGIGSWTPEYLNQLSQTIESVIIKSTADSMKLNSSAEIFDYLFKHRKGIGKKKIVLTASH
jgi:hypothetical protein